MNKTSPASLIDCIARLRSAIQHLIRIIDGLIAVVVGHESAKDLRTEAKQIPNEMVFVLAPMLQAIGSSSNTLVTLSDKAGLQTRDCYSIARSVIEAVVNVSYIMAQGADAAERALRHARQKSYQDLERESKIGDSIIHLRYSVRPESATIVGLDNDIAEFTSRAGREKGWIDASIDERIEVVGQKIGRQVLNSLHFARFIVYRHSSEVLHGTLFSALHFFGLTAPSGQPRTVDELTETIGQQHMLILFATALALSAVVESFHRVYGFAAAYDRSTVIIKSLRDIPYFQEASG